MSNTDPRPTESALHAAVVSLDESFKRSIKSQEAIRSEVGELREMVDDIPKVYLTQDIAKAKAKVIATILAILALIVIAVGGVGYAFHVRDARREADRREALVKAADDTRATLVAGCGRSNDQRQTLRNIIERAYTPGPISADLPPELRELILQSQERAAAQKAAQLAEPGVQPIDCEKAFPPIALAER